MSAPRASIALTLIILEATGGDAQNVIHWTWSPTGGIVVHLHPMHVSQHFSRRQFVASAAALLLLPRGARAMRSAGPHPTPRPGITAAKVLTQDKLGGKADLIELFDRVREIPAVIDGIRCQCGCATLDGFYSLLSCYEGDEAMAKICHICQGEGRLAVRLHKEGKSLDEIRVAIDAKFA